MKRFAASAAVLLMAAGLGLASPKTGTFTGQIMDSQCAAMGSHDAGYRMTGTHTPKQCTLACVKQGGKFVLYNFVTKRTYQLDNQKMPEPYAGENVKVIGTYNSARKTIHVEKIERAK